MPLTSDRFSIEAVVGEGSTARVYRARDRQARGLVAIKIFRKALLDIPELVARFEVECDLLSRFDHDNILRVVDRGRATDGSPWFATSFAEGGSLADRILRHGPIRMRDMISHAAEILDALTVIHEAGVVHRDVKPENILLDADDVAMLCDFGIALNPRRRGTDLGDYIGTPTFMAPEQYENAAKVTPRADLFGLGATIYVCVSRQSPMTLLVDHLRSDALQRLPVKLRRIIDRATAPRPEERYSTALEMSLDLAELA